MSQPTTRPLTEMLANALVNSSIAPQLEAAVNSVRKRFMEFMDANPNFFEHLHAIAKEIQNLPERQREAWATAAHRGWYINAETPASARHMLSKGQQDLDTYMMNELRDGWALLTHSIISAYPERKEILECAFKLHIEGRYIASIPLFLAQADGICAQTIGAHLFTDNDERKNKFAEMANNSDAFTEILLEILGMKTQFSAGISKYSVTQKALAPNRNGILHGSRRHLDYGSEVNSFKAFSLLAFVVFVLSEDDQGDGEHGRLS